MIGWFLKINELSSRVSLIGLPEYQIPLDSRVIRLVVLATESLSSDFQTLQILQIPPRPMKADLVLVSLNLLS